MTNAFITLEGPDGAGKSTQALRLAESLRARGTDVCLTREPGGTALGEAVREVLLAPTNEVARSALADALLFNASRAQLVTQIVRPALERGQTVICDRYTDSTLAYQGYGGGLPLDGLREIARRATGGLVPDLTILLDLPVAAGLARRRSGPLAGVTRFESEPAFDEGFHERVRQGYLALARQEPLRWRVVDADRAADEVAGGILRLVGDVLERPAGEPIASGTRIP